MKYCKYCNINSIIYSINTNICFRCGYAYGYNELECFVFSIKETNYKVICLKNKMVVYKEKSFYENYFVEIYSDIENKIVEYNRLNYYNYLLKILKLINIS